MKKYLYLVALVLTLTQFNSAKCQTFPRVNNDSTYLRKITVEEGARADMPIYFDTTGLNVYNEEILGDSRYFERFYTQFGMKINFWSKYFIDNKPDMNQPNYNTNETEIIELFDNVKELYGPFTLVEIYEDTLLQGRDFNMVFDSLINIISLYYYLIDNKSELFRGASYQNLPAKPVNSIEKDIDKINIFPNPSSDKISVDLSGMAVADLVAYDILGNEIMSIPNYTNKSEIDINTLSIGTYTMQVQTSTGSISQRLLVNR